MNQIILERKFYNYEKINHIFLYINLFCTSVFIIWALVPYLTRNFPKVFIILIICLWLITALLYAPKWVSNPDKLSLYITIWLIYIIYINVIGHGESAIGNILIYICFWFSALIYAFYKRIEKFWVVNYLLSLILAVSAITVLSNILIIYDDPNASKILTGSFGDMAGYYSSQTNLGNFSFAQSMALLTVVLVGLSLTIKKYGLKLLLILSIFLFGYMVILSSSVIAIISFMIILLICIYKKMGKNINRKFYFLLIFLLTFLLIINYNDEITNYLVSISSQLNNQLIAERVNDIAKSLSGELARDSSLSNRLELYKLSVITFINNPLWGIGFVYSTNIYYFGIGMHSQILDDLARYGLVGIIAYYFILKEYYKSTIAVNNFKYKYLVVSIMIGAIYIACFNPFISAPMGVVLFLAVPLWTLQGVNRIK